MKTNQLLLAALVVVLGSCSTAYRSGQTPDDVYYSPAPAREAYVSNNNTDDRNTYVYRNQEEREIRRGIYDRRYRNNVSLNLGFGYSPYDYYPYSFGYDPYRFDSYAYNPYGYGYKGYYDPFYRPMFSPYNPYYYGGGYYSGYYPGYYAPVIVVPGKKVNTNTGPRRYNLGAYNPGSNNNNGVRPGNINGRQGAVTPAPTRVFRSTTPSSTERRSTETRSTQPRRQFRSSQPAPRSSSNTERRQSPPPAETRSAPPARTFTPPPASSNSNNDRPASSAPTRTFRNN